LKRDIWIVRVVVGAEGVLSWQRLLRPTQVVDAAKHQQQRQHEAKANHEPAQDRVVSEDVLIGIIVRVKDSHSSPHAAIASVRTKLAAASNAT
jgi:hypothetical protein